jgi:hypothetical protein
MLWGAGINLNDVGLVVRKAGHPRACPLRPAMSVAAIQGAALVRATPAGCSRTPVGARGQNEVRFGFKGVGPRVASSAGEPAALLMDRGVIRAAAAGTVLALIMIVAAGGNQRYRLVYGTWWRVPLRIAYRERT